MSLYRKALLGGVATALATLIVPVSGTAQDRNCEGSEPRGGKWVTSAELYLQRARRNTDPRDRQERFRDAVEVLREGFIEQPGNPRNYAMAGEAYAGLNDYVNADSAFTKAEELWSCYEGHVDTLRYNAWVNAFNTAVRLSNSDDPDGAAGWYRNAWTVYKELPQPMIQLGAYYAKQAMDAEDVEVRSEAQEKAIDAFRTAISALEDPSPRLNESQRIDYARAATFNLAQLLAFEGKHEEAVQAYEKFLAQEPGNLDALSNLAVAATQAATEAEQTANDLEAGPEKDALLIKADSLRTMAAARYTHLLEREDLEPGDYFNLGVGLARLREHENAVRAFNITLDLVPYHYGALEQMALALFQLQQYDSLASVARTLVERYPLSMNYTALLANAYRELEQRQDALRILEQREALQLELVELKLEQGEGGKYTVSGEIHNLKATPGSPVNVVFDFYDDAGEVVSSESVTLEAPAQGEQAEFSVTTSSSMLISGFTYRRAEAEGQTGG